MHECLAKVLRIRTLVFDSPQVCAWVNYCFRNENHCMWHAESNEHTGKTFAARRLTLVSAVQRPDSKMPPNGVEEWRARIGQWENRKLRWYQAHSRSRRRVPLNLGRLIADLPNLCFVLLLLWALNIVICVCEAGKGALRSLVIRGRCCVRSVTARPTALFSIFLALSLLLIVAGDVETNPGPISGERKQ